MSHLPPDEPSPARGFGANAGVGVTADVDRLLDHAATELTRRFADAVPPETVRAHVRASYDELVASARVHTHLPVLAARAARQRLESLTANSGARMDQTPEVLFVCVHNAGRSQMAAALLQHHARGRVTVRSAGSTPADTVNPAVVEAMAEVGIDLSAAFPKPLTTEAVRAATVVITMGCGDACPVFPGKRYLDWQVPDPAGRSVEEVRPIRDEIDRRVRALLAELVPAT
ncbi:arsenate reductase ArsC [Streptoalloteichus hindustanus]|uniref:Protein-tyrosine-phosphatase n=1 Tax=Streptoalloteichus hindustanus TaxID=2017 RepID=A0A1M5EQ25_STRHI|nr:arsenate reductase ArsC [Streptoalloteichus hindustanus]SHF81267.1 Protein-tyrosine-phosphatase [Streptoalloteichus hindustanus]